MGPFLLSMEDPMCPSLALPPASTSDPAVPGLRSDAGVVFFIGSDPARPGDLPWPALAALAAADAVLHDGDIDPRTLALIPQRCFIERVEGGGAGATGENAVNARVRKLAGEGWRVVRLAVADPAGPSADFVEAEGLAADGFVTCTIAALSERRPAMLGPASARGGTAGPQPLGTGLNGLAG